MNNLPTTREQVLWKLAQDPRVNRNWLESLAYESGIDFDHIRGRDDEFSKEEFNNNQNENGENL